VSGVICLCARLAASAGPAPRGPPRGRRWGRVEGPVLGRTSRPVASGPLLPFRAPVLMVGGAAVVGAAARDHRFPC